MSLGHINWFKLERITDISVLNDYPKTQTHQQICIGLEGIISFSVPASNFLHGYLSLLS